jgi:hypothetical protein
MLHSSALQDSNEYLFNKEPASSTRKGKVSDVLKKKQNSIYRLVT